MPKQNIIATNFTSGEVSPLVRGRVDAQKYANGLETCENFIVRPQGPIWRRSGTKYLGVTKHPTQKSILVPFEYSDTKGYVLEIGVGYIHIWQNDGKLFESTQNELEAFKLENNGGLFKIKAKDTDGSKRDTPTFGEDGVGTINLSIKKIDANTNNDKVRVTTSIPHTLRTGAAVRVRCQDSSPQFEYSYSITRINNYCFDLETSFLEAATIVAGSAANTSVYTNGVIAGDRIYVSGATNYATLTEQYAIVQSVQSYSDFTINKPYVAGDTPIGEEGHVIPIEISTDYGYLPKKKIGSVAAHPSFASKSIITLTNHGYKSGDTIDIFKTNNAADGTYSIVLASAPDAENKFIIDSRYVTSSTDGYARKYVGESQLSELRFVQSADVMYIMHPDHPTCKLTRLSDDGDREDWLYTQVDFKDGPYLPLQNLAPTWDETTPANGSTFADVYFELSSYAHTATVTSATAFAAGAGTYSDDASRYIEYRDGDQWRLAKLPSTLAKSATTATVTIIDNVLLHLDESIKFTGTKRVKNKFGKTQTIVYNAGSPNLTPTVPGAAKQSKVDPNNYLESSVDYNAGTTGILSSEFSNTFSQSDVGKYVRFFDKGTHGSAGSALSATSQKPAWAQIARVNKGKSGKECTHDKPVEMALNNATGKFEITNHSRAATLKSYKNGATFAAFKATDVNRLFRIGWAGRWTWGKITAFTSTSEVSVSLYEDVPRDPHNAANLAGATNGALTASDTTGRSYDWRMGAWSDTTGYPSCGVFHEQRLWFGRTDTEPQTIWGSVAGDFENFSPTELDSAVLEDNAIGFTIASTKANPIKWMISGPAITVGTTGGEWQVKSSSTTSEPITPLNIVVTPHTSHGSHNRVQPVRIGNSVMFADRPGNRVRELIYDFSVDALVSKDLTYLSEHMLREGTGAIYSAYQQEPNNICWYVLNDGTLAAVTINKDQEIVAWHHHSISNGTSDAVVESIAVIPNTDSSKDNVYMVVKRGNNRYVELLQNDFYPNGTNRKGMAYLDGSVIFSGTDFSGTVVAGLHHLEGKTVTVTIDGTELGTYTVSGGAITIASQTSKELVVGVLYTSTAKSLPPEGGSAFGVSQGKIKKIAKYNVRLLNSLALDYGFNANGQSLNSITNLHEDGSIANTNFYTGTKELVPNNPYDAESQWTLSTSKPYPLNILSVTMTVEAGE